tara:strand:+ start:2626 stop:3486 length:861 start_codon:yes stop_codon:yes gene_type:complete
MLTVIGLGNAGCAIADELIVYPQYTIRKIDTADNKKDANFCRVEACASPEQYEGELPGHVQDFLKNLESETLFITSCGMISGMALRILEEANKTSKITVMYIVPEKLNLTEVQKLQNNLVFNVLQEYSRSALFERIILVDNKQIADIIGPVPVLKYWNSINNMIASTYHMINVFEHSRPVFTTFSKKVETARMTTIGLSAYDTNEEKIEKTFFSLDIPREKRYYYAVPQKMLEEDEMLMLKIQKQVKNAVEHDKMKVGYAIYSTAYDHPYVYCESYSTLVQKNPAL